MMTKKVTKKTPPLRFPEFEGEWEEKKLGDVADKPQYGMNSASKDFDGNNVYVRITDIDEETNKLYLTNLTSPKLKLSDEFLLKKGDLLFTRTGASTGKSFLFEQTDRCNYYYAGFLIRFSIKEASPKFISYQVQTDKYWKWVNMVSMRSGQPGINANEYSNLKLSIPTLPEQTKIASFMQRVDEWLETLTKQKENLEMYKKGVMQGLFSAPLALPASGMERGLGGVTSSSDQVTLPSPPSREGIRSLRFKADDGSDFPDWEEKKLGDVYIKSNLRNKGLEINRVFTNSAVEGIMKQTDYFDKDIAVEGNTENYMIVDKGDFIYNPRISNNAPVGPIKVNHIGLGVMSPLYTVFKLKSGDINFFEKYFQTKFWHEYMKSISNSGARHDRMNFSQDDFLKMPLPFPTLPEQTKIANFLLSLDNLINQKQKQIDLASDWKKGLMQGLFV